MDHQSPLAQTQLEETSSSPAEALLSQGEMRLLKGDFSGAQFFEKASQIDPNNPILFYRQGLALLEYGIEKEKEKALLLANKKFKMAALLSPIFFEVWLTWGYALYQLGILSEEHHYFVEAKEKYQKAIAYAENQESDLLIDLFWNYGVVWSHLATHSGEALDHHLALEAFQKAHTFQGEFTSAFWHDYGSASLNLASQINDVRLYVKAINCFKHALSLSGNASFEAWSALAHAMQKLFVHTHDEDHFTQANECFDAAARLGPQEIDLWIQWAELLFASGSYNQDVSRLRSCIEKCQHVYSCNPDHLLARAIWAQALAAVGELTDSLELVSEAENKISEVAELAPEDPAILYAYGICLYSCGNYFEDIDYYYLAIEKFQAGLSINRACDRLWYALAIVYGTIGDIDGDTEAFNLALRFFNKAIDLRPFSSTMIFDYALTLARFGEFTDNQERLEEAVVQFERALRIQKNAIYLHPEWLFHYACTLDTLGDFHAEESYYQRAIEILSHVLMIDPDFPMIHHKIALAYSHLGDLLEQIDLFYRASHHYRLAAKHAEEDDRITLDWGITLLYIATYSPDPGEIDLSYREAEHKITQAAKLGNIQAYYQLGCLYSLLRQPEKAMRFMERAEAYDALPPIEDLMDDEWLENLRITGQFQLFLAQLEKKRSLRE